MGTETGYEPAAHYDHVHGAWQLIMGDEFHYGFFATSQVPLELAAAALTDQMLARARIAPGERVLDIGCGTGRQACDLAGTFGASVLGITTSASGVAAATALASNKNLDGVRFEQRDGMDNGLPDASFDVVWVLESSHLYATGRPCWRSAPVSWRRGDGWCCATSSVNVRSRSERCVNTGWTSPHCGPPSAMPTCSRSRPTWPPSRSSA